MSSMQVDVLGEDLKFYINNIIFLLFYIKLQKYNSLRSSIEKALIFTNLKMYRYMQCYTQIMYVLHLQKCSS